MRPLFFLLLLPTAAHAQTPAARCLAAFLANDGDYQAMHLANDGFSPLMKLSVRDGHLFSYVWSSEPVSAGIAATRDGIALDVPYPDALPGIDDPVAARLAPYARREHRLRIEGQCALPSRFVVDIHASSGARAVEFMRIPTNDAEFELPNVGAPIQDASDPPT